MFDLNVVLLTHLFCTVYMTGLIWFVQVVHYPLMSMVGEANYQTFQRAHMRQTSWVVGPPMLLEALTAVVLVIQLQNSFAIVGLGLLVGIWLSTAYLQVPQHQALLSRFDGAHHRKLVRSNWVRTVLWTARMLWIGALYATTSP